MSDDDLSVWRAPSANRGRLSERSLLTNGRFLSNLNGWTASGGAAYSAGDGDDHYGVASLPAGASISQALAVWRARSYTLHLSVKTAAATITIVDGAGNSLPAQTASGAGGVWTETSIALGLAPGSQYTLTISNAGGSTILIDDVWLWWAPLSRSELAARVHRKLDALATDASFSTTTSGAQTEGSYTDAVDAGLRAVGAIDVETNLPDVRYLDAGLLDSCLDAIEREMLERAQRHYAALTDIKVGDRDEKLSQIAKTIGALSAGGQGGARGKVVMRTLRREANDYELG
jgi:hypothetical protein